LNNNKAKIKYRNISRKYRTILALLLRTAILCTSRKKINAYLENYDIKSIFNLIQAEMKYYKNFLKEGK